MKNKRVAVVLLVVLVLCMALAGTVLAMSSSSYQLPWDLVSSGGGIRSSSSYWLGDSTGQPATGISHSSSYRLKAGFWSGATVTPPTVGMPGDANGDDDIDALDITAVERIIAGLDLQTPGADANQDGSINTVDITKIARIIAGLG